MESLHDEGLEAMIRRDRWRLLVLLGCVLAVAGCQRDPARPGTTAFDPSYRSWSTLLARYINEAGMVDYEGLAQQPELVEQTLSSLREVDKKTFEGWLADRRVAFLINAHNAFAIARVLEYYPVASLEQAGAERGDRYIRLIGRRWSLREMADEVMSDRYRDARALFLLNWGRAGCAPLPRIAVTEENLLDLMERQARRTLAMESHCQYNLREKIVVLMPSINEYRKAIERDFITLWVLLEAYLPSEEAAEMSMQRPRIRFLEPNEALNDANLQPLVVIEGPGMESTSDATSDTTSGGASGATQTAPIE